MERMVILEFPTNQLRTDFIAVMTIAAYTLHKEKPVLYCKLSRPGIETAIKEFQAKDISYEDPDDMFSRFLDTLGWL